MKGTIEKAGFGYRRRWMTCIVLDLLSENSSGEIYGNASVWLFSTRDGSGGKEGIPCHVASTLAY